MPSTGTIDIGGKPYTWTSPTLEDLEEFEREVGSLNDLDIINSVRARIYLAHLCLREQHPEMTLEGVGRQMRADDYERLWPMIKQAIPLWEDRRPPARAPAPDGGADPDAPNASRTDGSPTSSISLAGSRAAPDESAWRTSPYC